LRRRDGTSVVPTSGKLGGWSIQAKCDDDRIVVMATRPGVNPLTGKAWSLAKSATDLFGPTSDLCRSVFTATPSELLYGGTIYRCPFKTATGPTVGPAFADFGLPIGMPNNQVTNTPDCPSGYQPSKLWAFADYGCGQTDVPPVPGPGADYYTTRYYVTQCGWYESSLQRWTPAIDAMPHYPSPNRWVGCGLIAFNCTRTLWN
jgi:hypothetical protein